MKPRKMPALFVGHGSPMNAIEDNDFTRRLRKWGASLPRPKAILFVSAHWLTEGTLIQSSPKPETVHDFRGFPEELHQVRYPAPGHPELARRARDLIGKSQAHLTDEWGLDHGAWSVLLRFFPQADVPVFQVSLDARKGAREHFEIGKRLAPLREEGVLIAASGNIVHNLGMIKAKSAPPYPWAVEFDSGVRDALIRGDLDRLLDYEKSFPDTAPLAVPTPDHYIPLLYMLALATDPPQFPYEGFEHASISLRSVQWGSS